MSFDMPFYETERPMKSAGDRRTSDDWKEENIDLEGLMQASSQANSVQDHRVPTFSSVNNTSRPSVLNINIPSKYQGGRAEQEQVSPHHPPYQHLQRMQEHFNYSQGVSPASSVSPASPYSQASPVSPHHQAPVSPHMSMQAQLSPHQPPLSPYSRSGSVSPVGSHHSVATAGSAVFSRYSMSDYLSGYSSCEMDDPRRHSPSLDKNGGAYKAKRERNNIAVRRSREKKKQRELENERRVKDLSDENSELQVKLGVVLKEMNLLKSLYKNIGLSLPPEAQHKLNKELEKISS